MAMSDVAVAPNLIEASLELAAARCEDLTPGVYRRLFAEHPQMQALFVRDTNHLVKGEMLARVIEAILDFAGERHYAATLIQCEVITHAGYDVPPDLSSVLRHRGGGTARGAWARLDGADRRGLAAAAAGAGLLRDAPGSGGDATHVIPRWSGVATECGGPMNTDPRR